MIHFGLGDGVVAAIAAAAVVLVVTVVDDVSRDAVAAVQTLPERLAV